MIAALAAAHLVLAAAAPAGKGAKPLPPPTHVQAATADYDYKRHRTVMLGDPLVVLTREDAKLVCKKLVTEDDEQGRIKHATCDGDVKLTRGDRQVTCAHAVYEAADGKVTCHGDPVLTDGDSVIHCAELVYVIDDDKVYLKQPKGTLVQKPGQVPVAKGKSK